jgi:hypothetical protein
MILLIGGIFIGLITILSLSHLGWFAVILLLWAIALIAAGIQNLRGNRPLEPGEFEEMQRRLRQQQPSDADSAEKRDTRP